MLPNIPGLPDLTDPLGMQEFREKTEQQYAQLAGLFGNVKGLFTPPAWYDNIYGNAAGLAQFIAGNAIIFLMVFSIMLFGWGVQYLPKTILASIFLSIVMNVIWVLTIETAPEVMSALTAGITSDFPPPKTSTTQAAEGTFSTMVIYYPAYGLGGIVIAMVKLLPYLSWVSLVVFMFGLAFVALGGKGARLVRLATFGMLGGSLLGYPLMYLTYIGALKQGTSNGVVTTFSGMMLLFLTIIIPLLFLAGGIVTEVVISRRSQSDVSGDVNATVDNTVDANIEGSNIDTGSHDSVNLDLYDESIVPRGSETIPSNSDATTLSTESSDNAIQVDMPESTSSQAEDTSGIGQKIDMATTGATLAGHPEVSAAIETARPQIEEQVERNES